MFRFDGWLLDRVFQPVRDMIAAYCEPLAACRWTLAVATMVDCVAVSRHLTTTGAKGLVTFHVMAFVCVVLDPIWLAMVWTWIAREEKKTKFGLNYLRHQLLVGRLAFGTQLLVSIGSLSLEPIAYSVAIVAALYVASCRRDPPPARHAFAHMAANET